MVAIVLICKVDDVTIHPWVHSVGTCDSSVVRITTPTIVVLNICKKHQRHPHEHSHDNYEQVANQNLHAWFGLSPSCASMKVSEQHRTSNLSASGVQRDKNCEFPGFSSVWQP